MFHREQIKLYITPLNKILSSNTFDIKLGIEAKIKLIESEYFENFVHSVADETVTINPQKQSEKLIDGLLRQFKNQYSSSETLQLFSGCNGTTQKYLSKKFGKINLVDKLCHFIIPNGIVGKCD